MKRVSFTSFTYRPPVRRAAFFLVLVLAPASAQASPLDVVGYDPETGAMAGSAIAFGKSVGVLQTNPALLTRVPEQVHLSLTLALPRAYIRPMPRPPGSDVPISIYGSDVGVTPGVEDRALPTVDLLNRRGDTLVSDVEPRVGLGVVSSFGLKRLRAALLVQVPVGGAASIQTHYTDEREAAFSNRLHFARFFDQPRVAAFNLGLGYDSTVDYLCWAGRQAIKHGLLPHTNAGILTTEDMTRLRVVNVSLGLMLESSSERLCQRGMPHHKAPDKRPHKRLKMMAEAGALRIPFTTGILIGIGETRAERIESLLAIRRLARAFGHIQEVIVQSFRARPGVPMESAPEPDDHEVAHAVAMARLILDPDIGVQAPPNLHPGATKMLLEAGINDFGGISPVTPDFINPLHAWPHIASLRATCEGFGYGLAPRLAIYDNFVEKEGFLEDALRVPVRAAQERLQ
jgi:7,8-didemethyl-8-hydroxy-5-deazariboflavin synthase CofG subunit